MKNFLLILIIIFTVFGFSSFLFIIFNQEYFSTSFKLDTELASNFGDFFGGFVGTLFSILSVLLLIYTIINQNLDSQKNDVKNNFFRMLDYHNENVKQLDIGHIDKTKTEKIKGRRAFVIFKIQFKRLLEVINKINETKSYNLSEEEIIDIAYVVLYYGLDKEWQGFIEEKLKKYKDFKEITQLILNSIDSYPQKIGRTNQTSLSPYFRNMYNAVKLVDEDKILTDKEKKELIKIYRAQLSNPELYILYFNVMSRFGKKWKENNYIIKYEFLKNIPLNYCDGYNPNTYFKINYEESEH